MATNAVLGRGAVVRLGVGAVGSKIYHTVPGARDFDFPDESVEEVDVTAHDSPANRIETIPGIVDLGNFEITYNWAPGSDFDEVVADIKSTRETVRIGIKPSGGVEEFFDGWVASWKRTAPVKGEMKAVLRVRITGLASTAGTA